MKSPRSIQRGILLLEALIAILLVSFGILGLVALWANSLKNASEAKYRTDASFLANEMIGQMWMDRVTINDDTEQPQAEVTINWELPGHAPHEFKAIAHINGAGAI